MKAEAGTAAVDSDPQRALQFGLKSLRAGGSYKLASLIWRLRKRDRLPPLARTLMQAKLAQRWWREDPDRAREWAAKSVETVESVPNMQGAAERGRRLATARLLIDLLRNRCLSNAHSSVPFEYLCKAPPPGFALSY